MRFSSGFYGKFKPAFTAVLIRAKENGGIAPAAA
jgi:hypothetical protein